MSFLFLGNYMKIIALSDMHGNLCDIKEPCDVVVIAGDWSPLYCQYDYGVMINYIDQILIPWMLSLKSDHVIFIPGNHDFVCNDYNFVADFNRIIVHHCNASDKIHFLCYDSITINNKKFYGNPSCEVPSRFCFSLDRNDPYYFDEDTDILVTHQPPLIGNVGYVHKSNIDFGSKELRDKIFKSNIELNICGHIHTGLHGGCNFKMRNGKVSCIYNVSMLDENYRVAFMPTIIEI